jgi:Xaa-Pro aminopeptidase
MQAKIILRIDKCRALLKSADIDTLMVSTTENRRYLSGFTGEDTQCDESAGALFISADHLVLATDSRFDIQAKTECKDYDIHCYREGLAKSLPEILKQLGTQRLGFESARVTHKILMDLNEALASQNMKVEMIPTENLVEQLREVKDEQEIQQTQSALRIAETAFTQILDRIKPGMTEKEIAWMLEKEMREAGAEDLSFPSIVASGPNSALPHAIPGGRMWQAGEPLLFDWGAKLHGYCSDISRTLVSGRGDKTFQMVCQTVLDAQQMAIDTIRDGVSTVAVDRIARSHIEAQGFKGKFGHGLGHGTGLAVHEAPRLSPFKDSILKSGMIVTVEPGIYLEDWGGVRIENQIVVRNDGAEVLNSLDVSIALD